MPKWLRVVIILVIVLVILAASAFMLLLLAFAGLDRFDLNHPENLAWAGAYILVLGGGIFGIVVLIRGFRPRTALTDAAGYPLPPQPIPAPDPEKVQWLSLAIITQIALSAMLSIYSLVMHHAANSRAFTPNVLVQVVISFVIFQAPYGALLLGLGGKIHKFFIALALTLPCAFVLHSAYYMLQLLHVYSYYGPRAMLPTAAIAAADIVIFCFALQLRQQLGQGSAALLVATSVLSLVYVIGASFAVTLLREMLSHMR